MNRLNHLKQFIPLDLSHQIHSPIYSPTGEKGKSTPKYLTEE